MRIKFRPGPTVRALAAPTDQSFAGYETPKVCVRKRGKWHCAKPENEKPAPKRAAAKLRGRRRRTQKR